MMAIWKSCQQNYWVKVEHTLHTGVMNPLPFILITENHSVHSSESGLLIFGKFPLRERELGNLWSTGKRGWTFRGLQNPRGEKFPPKRGLGKSKRLLHRWKIILKINVIFIRSNNPIDTILRLKYSSCDMFLFHHACYSIIEWAIFFLAKVSRTKWM